MVEHLPPDSAFHRAVHGTWNDEDELLLRVENRLRDVVAHLGYIGAELKAGLKVTGGSVPTPTYAERPAPPDWLDDVRDSMPAVDPETVASRAELDSVMYREPEEAPRGD